MTNQNENYRFKKYRDDTVFQVINRKYLTLPDEERKSNNAHLKSIIEAKFVPLMKKNELFAIMYKRIMYGGSYYKGTKYGKPEEFDLDFILKLPVAYPKIEIDTNHENYGFVKIKVDLRGSPMKPEWEKHRQQLSKFLTSDNYFDQNKFRSWMENVFTSAFSICDRNGRGFEIVNDGKTYLVRHKKSGPAFTMIITTPEGSVIDVDLVPAFEFDHTLGNGYRRMDGGRKTWMVVAKPLSSHPQGNVLWRLCFYEQEKDFLQGDMKPVIRMMKKFRDSKNWKSIASYYIETVFYHEIESHENDLSNYLRAPKTYLFMTVLKKLKDALEKKHLSYFWHPRHNLFERLNHMELFNIANNLNRTIVEIDNKIESDRWILAEKVLARHELLSLRGTESDILEGSALRSLHISTPQVVTHSTYSFCTIM